MVSWSPTHRPYTNTCSRVHTQMHIHAQCSGHSASTTLCDPGVSSFRQAKNMPALSGREGTALSLSLLLHGCSAIGSNNPSPDLRQHGGAVCCSSTPAPRAAEGTFMVVGVWPWQWAPSARAALSPSWILALPRLSSGCPHKWPISFFSCTRGHYRRELKGERE